MVKQNMKQYKLYNNLKKKQQFNKNWYIKKKEVLIVSGYNKIKLMDHPDSQL